MSDYDRTRDDVDAWRGRDDERSGWSTARRYETDYDRDRGRRDFGGRYPDESFGRGSRDYSGSTPYRPDDGGYGPRGRGYDQGRGDVDWRDRDLGARPRYGAGSMERDWRGNPGRSMSEMAFGRDASGRDRQGPGYGRGYDDERGERGFFERAGDEVASWFGDDDAERRRRQDRRDDERSDQYGSGYGQGYGEHRGRGPRNYQRSDERIQDDVNDRLTDDHRLDASGIDVAVSQREVTLSGTVRGRSDKRRAEDIAESVSGVAHVQNNLRVQQASDTSWAGSSTAARNQDAGTRSDTAGTLATSGATWGDTPKV